MTRRLSQLSRVSSMAIAVVLTAGAAAQSFQGSSSTASGDVFVSTGAGTTDVLVNSSQAVIDWTPTDNAPGTSPINFQPAGTTATFTGFGPFAVLNRINVADANRVISLNGTIQSSANGAIYFYSPSGFVVGSTALINVGSFVLSASPLTLDGNGNFLNGGVAQFGQAPNVNAAITTLAGSQINASGAGSYVALVAPQIVHQGTIRTDTAAALVAAEAATITFSPDGLFDIEVTTGTDASTGIHVDGGTIARNSAVEGSDHHAYLVAVAKNDAVTMLINNGASIGFDTATSATVEGNSVVLSGGYDVQGGGQWTPAGTSQVDLTITNANFSSGLNAEVSGGVAIHSADGALSFGRDLTVFGGEMTTVGGNVLIDAANGNALTIGGELYARAYRRNADGSETGLLTRLGATGGSTISIGGSVWLNSDSNGAPALDNGENGTNAIGGNAQINIGANSTLTIGGDVSISADGYGGDHFYSDGSAGNGTGGTALLMAITGNANVNIAGSTYVSAQGYGGSAGECSVCNIVGGTGTGGNASVHTNVGSNNQMTLGNVVVAAAGYGGAGDAQAGQGIGGTAALSAGDSSILTVTGDALVDASGYGGFGFENVGGLGRGGNARIDVYNGGAIGIDADALVIAEGVGGSNFGFTSTGAGGVGEGGLAQIYAGVGSITIGGFAEVVALADGGEAFTGRGGDAFGGSAHVGTDGGTINFSNDLYLDASATGGEGSIGGNATARVSPPTDELSPIAVALYTGAGGSITVNGTALMNGSAQGGSGTDGNGGNATAGEADVVAYVGDIDVNNLIIAVDANGGDGGNGGRGGDAQGGVVDVAFGFGAAAVGGTLTIGSGVVIADGIGGDGGAGIDANTGGDGGAGGNGTGGSVLYVGSAAGGMLDSGATFITVRGEGGAGGTGGNGDTGVGGNGGAGGNAIGGFIQTGSISADQAPGTGGGANYAILQIDTSANGGQGGNAGTGGAGTGVGGNGGNAEGGSALFLSRGVLVTANDVVMLANATGGDGGSGSTDGDGGDATTGAILIESKDRFGHPTQRGTLNVGTISGSAIAIGGTGASDGTSTALGSSYFRLLNGDAAIGSVDITVVGDVYDASFGPSYVSVRDGTMTVGDFSFVTSGDLGLDGSNGSMTASSIALSAGNFVPVPATPAPTVPATYTAGSFDISTGGNFITNANLVSGSDLVIVAPGAITMANASATGSIDLAALGDSLSAGAVTAGGYASLYAATSIATGAIQSGSFLSLDAVNGISTGNLSASGDISAFGGGPVSIGNASSLGGSIFLDSGGALNTGNLDALFGIELTAIGAISFGDSNSDTLDFDSGGAVSGGNIIAGTSATGEAQGAVSLGNINVGIQRSGGATEDGFAAGFLSATSINVGNVAVDEAIGFATFGTLTTGNLSAGPGVMALVGGNMSFGSIATAPNGQVYLADAQMFLDAGGPDAFDPLLVLAASPVPTGGSITIAGPVSTGLLQAAAGTGFSAAGMTAVNGIDVSAGGLITVGGAWNGSIAYLTSNDIDITAAGSITASDIELVSTNAQRTIVGDGVGLPGYNLSNAEYNRLGGGDINIAADTALGAAPTMIIGNLNVAVPANSEIEYDFTTWNSQTGVAEGSIRIVGNMAFTGMSAFDVIDFTTQRFELDAETGSLSLTGAGNALSGTVEISAANIHVASGAILDQLAANPQYQGYQDALNAPATVQRPEGVLRAGSVAIEFTNAPQGQPYTLYVQNTGTQALPAGFVVSDSVLFSEGSEQSFAPGSIDVVINGQIETPNGTLTGAAVRDALVAAEGDLTPFTATSTINGCLFVGSCGLAGPFPPGFTPTPGIQDIIQLVDLNQLPPPEFGNEDFIDDNDEETEDSQTSPIVPPAPLFDTSEMEAADGTVTPEVGTPMRSSPGIKREGDVDDPVSGTGNPALMEGAPPPSSNQEKQP